MNNYAVFEPDCLQSGSLRTINTKASLRMREQCQKTRNCMLAHMQFSVARRRRRRRNRAFESAAARFRHSRVSRARVREARSDPVKTKTRKATKKPPKRQKVVEIEMAQTRVLYLIYSVLQRNFFLLHSNVRFAQLCLLMCTKY